MSPSVTFVRSVLLAACTLASVSACRRGGATTRSMGAGSTENGIAIGQAPAIYLPGQAPTSNSPGAPGVMRMIGIGAIVSGTLQSGDTVLPEGRLADDYVVHVTAGVPITIVTRGGPSVTSPGSTLDMYTILMQNGTEVTHDDDSASTGTALNSRIVFTPWTTGAYIIRVTTFGSRMNEGAYTLQTYAGALYTQM